jgi:hypothetical protein
MTPPQIEGTYILLHHLHDSVVVVKGPDGRTQEWIRGFTYKPWQCAASGDWIVSNPHGDHEITDGWAWRIYSPLSQAWARIRISDRAFKLGTFTISPTES